MTRRRTHEERIAAERHAAEEVKKKVALMLGWPDSPHHMGWLGLPHRERKRLLKKLPGSWESITLPADCPIKVAFAAAVLDLYPLLLARGLEGQYLSYGYGPGWYAVAETQKVANAKLMRENEYQIPMPSGKITGSKILFVANDVAVAYYQWKYERAWNSARAYELE